MHIPVAGLAAILYLFGVHPIIVIVLAALLGLVLLYDISPQQQTPCAQPVHGPKTVYFSLIVLVGVFFSLLYVFQRPLFELAAVMFRIDLFAFGGGFASLPLMFREVVDVHS